MNLLPSGFRISLIKRLDSIIGRLLVRLLTSPVTDTDVQLRSVLIIRPGGIGDALLLAATINSLRLKYPHVTITILAEKRNAGAFALIPAADKLLLYDKISDLFYLLESSYDLIVDTEQWHRMSAVIARAVSSGIKIGFGTNERRRLFTHPVPYSHADYEAQSFLNLLYPIGIKETFDHSSPFLSLPESADREVADIFNLLKPPYVTVFPGASIKERRWDVARFRALVNSLSDLGVSSVIIGGKEDKISGDSIVAGTSGLNFCGQTSLAGTAALIARSRLLVSGDSGVLHIGVGLGTPTVSLFGAGISKKWAPKGDRHKVVNKNLSCSPCTLFGTTPACPYDVRCLKEIKAEEVFEAVCEILFRSNMT